MNKKIKIITKEKKYIIEIDDNFILKKIKKLSKNKNKKIIIIDSSVKYLLKNTKSLKNFYIITIKGSEKIKNLKNFNKLANKILKYKVDRDSIIIAIGGGSIGDLAGLLASTILRGINYILIPTTLLSQVDSSIGGKNGINTNFGKNLIGTFYQPDEVLIDINFLKTLPKKELKSGYAEIIKHAIINDLSFFKWLDKNYKKIFSLEKKTILYTIYKSIKIKSKFVSSDTKEVLLNSRSRAMLNFGHTFGHALETFYKYNKYTHGEAISIGMVVASKLSKKICKLSEDDLNTIINHFKKIGLPTNDINLKNKKIFNIVLKDKKNIDNRINLVLIKKIGQAYYLRNQNPKSIFKLIN